MFRVMELNICYGVIRMIDWGKRKKEKKIQGGDFARFFRRLEVLLVMLFMTTCFFFILI